MEAPNTPVPQSNETQNFSIPNSIKMETPGEPSLPYNHTTIEISEYRDENYCNMPKRFKIAATGEPTVSYNQTKTEINKIREEDRASNNILMEATEDPCSQSNHTHTSKISEFRYENGTTNRIAINLVEEHSPQSTHQPSKKFAFQVKNRYSIPNRIIMEAPGESPQSYNSTNEKTSEFQEENLTQNNIIIEAFEDPCQQSNQTNAKMAMFGGENGTPQEPLTINEPQTDSNSWEEGKDFDDCLPSSSSQQPSRSTRSNSLGGTRNRTIAKPKRIKLVHKDPNSLTSSELKRLYTSKKVTNFKPACLETIREESAEDVDNNQFLGTRKLRRAITFNGGIEVNKALIKKRRNKIKNVIGRRLRLKKIPMEDFKKMLEKSLDDKDEPETSSAEMDGLIVVKQIKSL